MPNHHINRFNKSPSLKHIKILETQDPIPLPFQIFQQPNASTYYVTGTYPG